MHALTASPAAIAASTPADRDRYLDLLRGLAITVVVLGHWLLAVVWLDGADLRVTAVLDAVPVTRWVTWVVQVMPLFFLVGGVVNARSWRAARSGDQSYATWLGRRAARLLRPTTVVVWTWVGLAVAAPALGVERSLLTLAARNALVPLWFLAVYLLLVAATPVLLAIHDAWGLRLPGALIVAAVAVDLVVRAGATPVGIANYLLVWGVPTALGFAWTDGLLDVRTIRVGAPLAALAALVAAVAWLGWPVSMIRVGEAGGPNHPVATLALLGCVQAGVALAVRARVTPWLDRPGPWAAVVRVNAVAMTVYLWHLTVLVLMVGGLTLTGSWWSVAPLSAAWWASRPLWLLALAVVLAPVTFALVPVERGLPSTPGTLSGRRADVGMALAAAAAAVGTALLVGGGVARPVGMVGAIALTLAARHTGAFGATAAVTK